MVLVGVLTADIGYLGLGMSYGAGKWVESENQGNSNGD